MPRPTSQGVRKKYTVDLPDFGITISFWVAHDKVTSIRYGSLGMSNPDNRWTTRASGGAVEVVERICREKGVKPP